MLVALRIRSSVPLRPHAPSGKLACVSSLRPGETLRKKFLIEAVIGSGGMGTVYQAVHVRMQKRVAIKVLDGSRATDPANVSRFEREGLAAARLRGPHAVRVYDVDTAESGEPFLVMELLRGRELSKALADQNHPRETLIDWGIQICTAIHEAHDLGIVHRDLKPSNVFVLYNGDRIKIVDFGISKMHDGVDITTDSQVLGTPKYMSPEQLQAMKVGPQSDIWAIGIILYRMLTGAHPFPLPKDAPPFVLAASTLTMEPVPILDLAPDLPGELAEAVMKCLRKPVHERWQSARELARRLEPFGSGRAKFEEVAAEPSASRPPMGSVPEEPSDPLECKPLSVPPTSVEVPSPNPIALVKRDVELAARGQTVGDDPSLAVLRSKPRRALYAASAVAVVTLAMTGLFAVNRWSGPAEGQQPISSVSGEHAEPPVAADDLREAGLAAAQNVPATSSNVVPPASGASVASTQKMAPVKATSAKPQDKPPPSKPPATSQENPLFL
jgi:serine/threonine-protein kinase